MSSHLSLAVTFVVVSTTFIFAEDELKETKVGEVTLKVPASWKQSEPTNRLRLAQFEIPAAEGDQESAELAIFSFGGGGVQANIDRWIGQFDAEGRKSKVTSGKADLGQYVFVDVTGTYMKPVGPPILRKTEPMPGARMLAVILAVEGVDAGLPDIEVTGPSVPLQSAGIPLVAGLKHLPVTFTPTAPVGT